jgi:hypothetical protein
MIFEEVSFHDSEILEVRENSGDQSLDFFIEFPVNWRDNKFEPRILRFTDVISYSKNEIPFTGNPTILEIKIISSSKIEMVTNAGSRIIEFSSAKLMIANNN